MPPLYLLLRAVGSSLTCRDVALVPERGDDRSVIAGAEFAENQAGERRPREVFRCKHVIETPADVSAPEVSPGSPPGEEVIVLEIEGPADVDQPAVENALQESALFGSLADRVRFPFLRVNVALGPSHVDVPADDERSGRAARLRRIVFHRLEEAEL